VNDPAARKAAREFDRVPATHPQRGESPAVVRADLRDRYARFIRAHPEAPRRGAPERPFPGWERNLALAREEYEWVNLQVTNAWRVLTKGEGGCRYCHSTPKEGNQADDEPAFAPAGIPRRWLPHGLFNHESHRMLDCAECHAAKASKETSDVLLPGMASCQKCHNSAVGARSDCVECHRYHDRDKERGFAGQHTIDEYLGKK
jgi:hypothetical protein